ncbi:hypothetical protein F8388_020147 [Cannabis sativa]|uniref:Ethylene insensitive 3-like DNA-binding domain-containing protein n=1 Tax=Cannabis sativa TaxID=3483 RepID=A0A7J6FIM2_CANSA|nr:hypothetical protein F8388_020147 [Cannabis sativa]KAF4400494.1 hypothetical protein G4B88_023287 [Cannabis sativa]
MVINSLEGLIPREERVVTKTKYEEEEEEENISYDELERRMWKDRMRMEQLISQNQSFHHHRHHYANQPETSSDSSYSEKREEASRRKKMARAQDVVLQSMFKIMEACNAKGFVYGIVPETGKPLTGSSDSLRSWWKETVNFDKAAPLAIVKSAQPPVIVEEAILKIISSEDDCDHDDNNCISKKKRKCTDLEKEASSNSTEPYASGQINAPCHPQVSEKSLYFFGESSSSTHDKEINNIEALDLLEKSYFNTAQNLSLVDDSWMNMESSETNQQAVTDDSVSTEETTDFGHCGSCLDELNTYIDQMDELEVPLPLMLDLIIPRNDDDEQHEASIWDMGFD